MKTLAAVSLFAMALTVPIAVSATGMRDGAVIRNTGSTNFPGYTIKVWSDGSALAVPSNRAGAQLGKPQGGNVPLDLTGKFFRDLKAAKLSGRVVSQSCMKSASFGSTMIVQYHGWTSPDLECPGGGFVVSIASEAHQIAAALHMNIRSIRRPLLPNEPRRTETTPGQASPMPESTPPAT